MPTRRIESSDLSQLRLILIDLFNLNELKDLCFTLDVNYDLLAGEELGSKARELVDYVWRRGQVQDLIVAIQTARPDADLRSPTPTEQPCPYHGLFAFGEEDAANFFGRETYTDALATAIENQSFVAFVGPSGSGKSSVVFAGLIPRLKSEPQWQIIDFRPGDRPFYNLAAALVTLDETLTSLTERLDETRRLAKALDREDDPLSLNDVISDLLQGKAEGSRLLLVADQFEELYTLVPDPVRHNRFLDQLLALDDVEPTVLLLTLRADFLGQALKYRSFADALQDHDIKLGPMTTEELRTAIRNPAQNAGVSFELGLEDRIVRDLADEPGNLPLLQFALTEMWGRQAQQQLTYVAYEEIGRVDGALAHYADQVYEDLDKAEQIGTRDVFLQLVHPGPGTDYSRRLALRTELSADDWQVAQQLASARLVVTGQDADGRETVEVVHEALIRDWKKLRDWLEADRAYLIWLSRLRFALEQWQKSEENEDALLQGIALDEARVWLAERGDDLAQAEQTFIESSVKLQERRIAEQEAQQRRERMAKRLCWVVVALIAIILIGGLWLSKDRLLLRCLPDCSNWDWLLRGVDWSGEDMSGVNLRNSNLSGANLNRAVLSRADLSGTDLSEADLLGVDLSEADLSGANLRRADLLGADLSRAVLIGANLRGVDLLEADLSEADLLGADLSETALRRANLRGADLSEADLSRAFLLEANLRGTNLRGTNLREAFLSGVNLSEADLSEANLSEANLRRTILSGVFLRDVNLSGADLIEADLRGANLREAVLHGAGLIGTKYDANTQWPDNFDPEAAGALLVEGE